MGISAALVVGASVIAYSQISQGYAQRAEANYNATLLEGQANLIDVQSQIEFGQYQRAKGQNLSTTMNRIAGSGIEATGSPMAYLLNAQTQIGIDQAIGQFNYTQERNYTMAQASQVRRQGRQAVTSGYYNAFSTMLQAGSSYAIYNRGSSLDMDGGGTSQYGNVYGRNTPRGTYDTGTYSRFYA